MHVNHPLLPFCSQIAYLDYFNPDLCNSQFLIFGPQNYCPTLETRGQLKWHEYHNQHVQFKQFPYTFAPRRRLMCRICTLISYYSCVLLLCIFILLHVRFTLAETPRTYSVGPTAAAWPPTPSRRGVQHSQSLSSGPTVHPLPTTALSFIRTSLTIHIGTHFVCSGCRCSTVLYTFICVFS